METSLHHLAASATIAAKHAPNGVAQQDVTATDQLHQIVVAILAEHHYPKFVVPGQMTIVVLHGAVTIQEDESHYVAPAGAIRVVGGKHLSMTATADATLLISCAAVLPALAGAQSDVAVAEPADCTQ